MRQSFKIGIRLFILGLLFLGAVSCDNDDESSLSELTSELEGSYTGVFTVEYSEDPIFYDQLMLTNEVTIEFENGTFTCSNGENFIPAGGSGTYEMNGTKITFNDENGWFANFDWNLILDGEYNIGERNSEIVISARKEIGSYTYRLAKP